jgi:peptidoglycan/xylan/chitin deacetylase (PgdA/CDA1 family)
VTPPILCYHKVDTRFELGFTQLGPRVFVRQMRALSALRYETLGAGQLGDALAGRYPPDPAGGRPAAGTVVLTFDDGYQALARHAFPAVADHGFRALVFAITDHVGGENAWDVRYGWRTFRHLSWDELGLWSERGVEVHSHTATHRRLTWLSDGEVEEELCRSREEIARRLGSPPLGVSYPFGAADLRVRDLAARAGYSLGFAGPAWGSGPAARPDPLLLARLPVYGWDRAAPPLVMSGGAAGGLARGVARLTNRFAVVTSVLRGERGGSRPVST